jgi:hypothetical protein
LKLEYDDRDEDGRLLDQWFYGTSTKRYVQYRIVNGQPVIVKDGWSSHGLGYLLHGNSEDEDEEIHDKWEKELWLRIIRYASGELSEDALCEEYSDDYAIIRYAVTKPNLHRRLRGINRRKEISKQIKPFNFVLVGQAAESGRDGEPIHPITRFTKRLGEGPFLPFVDYNTGKRYPGGSQLYWKSLSTTVREYLNLAESKFSNGHQTGKMKRRHLHIQEKGHIHYIGKEANEIEENIGFGSDEESYVKYQNRDQMQCL